MRPTERPIAFQCSAWTLGSQLGSSYRNIYYWQGDRSRLFHPDRWPNFDLVSDFNLYWDASGKPPRLTTLSFDEWKQKGLDANSLVTDPKFIDPQRGDFSLASDSPVFRLGFRPIDLREVGLRPNPPIQIQSSTRPSPPGLFTVLSAQAVFGPGVHTGLARRDTPPLPPSAPCLPRSRGSCSSSPPAHTSVSVVHSNRPSPSHTRDVPARKVATTRDRVAVTYE